MILRFVVETCTFDSTVCRPALGVHMAPTFMRTIISFLGVQRPEREAKHSHLHGRKFKNATAHPQVSIARSLIKALGTNYHFSFIFVYRSTEKQKLPVTEDENTVRLSSFL